MRKRPGVARQGPVAPQLSVSARRAEA